MTIKVQKGAVEGTGSGFIVASNGIVVTAAHVIRDAQSAQIILPSGQALQVFGVLHSDASTDLAILKVDASGLPTVTLGNSDSVEIGQRLIAVGSPLGLELTVSDGLLSGVRGYENRRLLQISIPVSPGSSGGPVVLEDGRVVGLVVAGLRVADAENLNFAVPINYVREMLPLVAQNQPRALGAVADAGTSASPTGPDMSYPASVNDSLQFDWAVLDGTSGSLEYKPQRSIKMQEDAWYGLSLDPTGTPTLEKTQKATALLGNGGIFETYAEAYRDEVRVVIPLKAIASSGPQEFAQRTSLVPQVASGTVQLTVVGGVAEMRLYGGVLRRRAVPRGVIPLEMLNGAIAALPDSLPHIVFIWTITADTSGALVSPAKVQFGTPTEIGVRYARNGSRCGRGVRTEIRRSKVVPVTITIGASTDEHWVLARKPHLPVYNGPGCVGLPSVRR